MNDAKIQHLRKLLQENNHKFFSVDFVKKDGTLRKLNGHVRYVAGHDDVNPVAHLKQYVTVVLSQQDNGKPVWRNVNLETVKRIAINKKEYKF